LVNKKVIFCGDGGGSRVAGGAGVGVKKCEEGGILM